MDRRNVVSTIMKLQTTRMMMNLFGRNVSSFFSTRQLYWLNRFAKQTNRHRRWRLGYFHPGYNWRKSRRWWFRFNCCQRRRRGGRIQFCIGTQNSPCKRHSQVKVQTFQVHGFDASLIISCSQQLHAKTGFYSAGFWETHWQRRTSEKFYGEEQRSIFMVNWYPRQRGKSTGGWELRS